MDIQVLNEIANQARQTPVYQVKASIAANAQLKALKGSAVPVSADPSKPPSEDILNKSQAPVAPDISPVARAASLYSSGIDGELNPDELRAIQSLAGRVRTVVSEFLSQPGLEQAENAAAVVASNLEAVQELVSDIGQAVVEALDLNAVEGEEIGGGVPESASIDLPESVPASGNPISIERITKGGQLNNPVGAAGLAGVDLRASEHEGAESPLTVEEVHETPRGDFRVAAPIPVSQISQAGESIPVETLEGQPAAVVAPQQEPAGRPEAAPAQSQVVPVPVPGPDVHPGETVISSPQEPAGRPETVATNQQEAPVQVDRPAPQNTQANENIQVETPVSRSEVIAVDQQQTQEIVEGPEPQNAPEPNKGPENPVVIPITPADQGQRSEGIPTETVSPEASAVASAGAGIEAAASSRPQPESTPQPSGPVPSSDLFAHESATVNSANIRDANQLVGSVVNSEFTAEAKKIFSEPKVIRTVADLADFILERLQEIIAIKQQQSQSSNETVVS